MNSPVISLGVCDLENAFILGNNDKNIYSSNRIFISGLSWMQITHDTVTLIAMPFLLLLA
jgi:hypothetical protein